MPTYQPVLRWVDSAPLPFLHGWSGTSYFFKLPTNVGKPITDFAFLPQEIKSFTVFLHVNDLHVDDSSVNYLSLGGLFVISLLVNHLFMGDLFFSYELSIMFQKIIGNNLLLKIE